MDDRRGCFRMEEKAGLAQQAAMPVAELVTATLA